MKPKQPHGLPMTLGKMRSLGVRGENCAVLDPEAHA
jgi:hypothetical protein